MNIKGGGFNFLYIKINHCEYILFFGLWCGTGTRYFDNNVPLMQGVPLPGAGPAGASGHREGQLPGPGGQAWAGPVAPHSSGCNRGQCVHVLCSFLGPAVWTWWSGMGWSSVSYQPWPQHRSLCTFSVQFLD